MWENVMKRLCRHRWNALQHGSSERRLDGINVRSTGPSGDFYDSLKLVHCGGPREKRFMCQQLTQNTTKRPKINTLRVFRGAEQNLWCPIPASCDIVCKHWSRPTGMRILQSTDRSCKTEITHF